ncbi:MAG: putative motility protein [Lachnospiraceae bacterium]|nr:putative motility protein [Lachnospiraceae bacterium]
MDIASLSTALSMTKVNNEIGVLMLGKQLDQAEVMGESMVKLLEQSASPNLGRNIDVSV